MNRKNELQSTIKKSKKKANNISAIENFLNNLTTTDNNFKKIH